jgi:hypothetical protein
VIFNLRAICQFDGDSARKALLEKTMQTELQQGTFYDGHFYYHKYRFTSATLYLRACKALLGGFYTPVMNLTAKLPAPAPVPQGFRLRVGFMTMVIVKNTVLTALDPARFEVFCVSMYADWTEEMINAATTKACQRSYAFGQFNNWQAAELLNSLNLHLLIDYDVFDLSTTNRANIYAEQPAPIQINGVTFYDTSGLGFFQYLVAEPSYIPPDLAPHASEKLLFAHSYYLGQAVHEELLLQAPSADALAAARLRHEIPLDAPLLCSFNNMFKFDEASVRVWFEVLLETPEAILWVWMNPTTCEPAFVKEVARWNLTGRVRCATQPRRTTRLRACTHDVKRGTRRPELTDATACADGNAVQCPLRPTDTPPRTRCTAPRRADAAVHSAHSMPSLSRVRVRCIARCSDASRSRVLAPRARKAGAGCPPCIRRGGRALGVGRYKPQEPREDHLASMGSCDLFVDSPDHNGKLHAMRASMRAHPGMRASMRAHPCTQASMHASIHACKHPI